MEWASKEGLIPNIDLTILPSLVEPGFVDEIFEESYYTDKTLVSSQIFINDLASLSEHVLLEGMFVQFQVMSL